MPTNVLNRPLPAGGYTLEIVESEYTPNKFGTGMVLKCKAQVVGGEFDGRPFWIDYHLEHRDPRAVEIGQREFAGLRKATGVLALDDSEQLHFKAFGVKLGLKEGCNVITEYVWPADAGLTSNGERTAYRASRTSDRRGQGGARNSSSNCCLGQNLLDFSN